MRSLGQSPKHRSASPPDVHQLMYGTDGSTSRSHFVMPVFQEMNENIEERINLQKALFEIEDANIFNK